MAWYKEGNKTVIEVTDTDYFFMIDNQVRPAMQEFESKTLLPVARSILTGAGVELTDLKEFPTEGYYYETEELRQYFQILRNLQHNDAVFGKVKDSPELQTLKKVCNNDLFGSEDPYGRDNGSPIQRRYDILTLTMENTEVFPNHNKVAHPWNITRIMEGLGKSYKNRTNLVEMAYLTKEPKCLCCGAETNILYRMFACVTGSFSMGAIPTDYVWKVTPELEDLGKRVVAAYNEMMQKDVIKAPTLAYHLWFKKAPKVPRVAMLGYSTETGEYYHWILNSLIQLYDVYSKQIITTESFAKNQESTEFKGNIFNAVPVPASI